MITPLPQLTPLESVHETGHVHFLWAKVHVALRGSAGAVLADAPQQGPDERHMPPRAVDAQHLLGVAGSWRWGRTGGSIGVLLEKWMALANGIKPI